MVTAGKAARRARLGPLGYAWIRSLHLVVAMIWVGSGVATLYMLVFVMNAETVVGTHAVAHTNEVLVWRPCAILVLLTGLIFSVYGNWGFVRRRWIWVKYSINLLPLALGYILLSLPSAEMRDQVRDLGAAAWQSASFQQARWLFVAEQSGIFALLLTASVFGVFKPDLGQKPPLPGIALRILKVVRETADAVSISFRVPAGARETFRFKAGQYLTLITRIGGREQRRAYSLSTSPLDGDFAVAVRRDPHGGLVSNWLNDHARPGRKLHILPPAGRFSRTLDFAAPRSYFLFAGGSGITPVLSILRTVLASQPASTIALLYANRTPASAMFKTRLDALAEAHPNFTVDYLFDRLDVAQQGLGRQGLVDAEIVGELLTRHPPVNEKSAYMLCGPSPFMQVVVDALHARGVADGDIYLESFDTLPAPAARPAVAAVEARLGGARLTAEAEGDETILEALLRAGFQPPYACQAGNCSTCVARLTEGQAIMKTNRTLTPSEVAAGLVLTCQAVPATERVVVDFDASGLAAGA